MSLTALLLLRKFPPKCPCVFPFVRSCHSRSDPTYQLNITPAGAPGTKSCDIFISTCRNIFYNLAFEDWLYENVDFSSRNVLLLWKSDPCVVIGRHQNPLAECNLSLCTDMGISVARRKSGGGTVYHDHGNLNCSFFTNRKSHDRKVNLDIIANALQRKWNVDVEVNDRDDIMLQKQYKISGTAAKLGGKTAYHHCTVLFNADTSIISSVLQTQMVGLNTKATTSVRSTVKNLCDVNHDINYEGLVDEISREYQGYYSFQKRAVYIDPTKVNKYPGLIQLYQDLKSWQWVFGKSPKFTVQRTFDGFPDIQHAIGVTLEVSMEVEKGHISTMNLKLNGYPQNLQPHDVNILCHIMQEHWKGRKFAIEKHSAENQLPQIQFLSRNGIHHEPETWGFTKDLISWMQKCLGSMLPDDG